MKDQIHLVVLAGGSGTRLWPQSREKSPKQFIPLFEGRSLFQETCLRFKDSPRFSKITVVTNADHRFLVRDQLLAIGIKDASILTEPAAKNTLAACLFGAHFLLQQYGDVPILFCPSDHSIKNTEPLVQAIATALPYVQKGNLCTFGIQPTMPHTGYGYIVPGEALTQGLYTPKVFIEKPELARAEALLKEGALWNSGIYFSSAQTLINESSFYTKDHDKIFKDFFSSDIQPEKEFYTIPLSLYETLPPLSIDKGVTEHTKNGIVATTPITWNDLGSWASLHNYFDKNEDGNVVRGDTLVLDTKNSYIESTSRLVSVVGLNNTAVIETPDAIAIFPLHQSESVKKVVASLSDAQRSEVVVHTTVHRPWGHYTVHGNNEQYQLKKITVLPGAALSLQRHKYRAEHWIVIQGIATVTCDEKVFELRENESTFLPIGATHMLQNKHQEPLLLIEVQTGTYFGEDDIERFSDTYGRL